MSGAYYNEIDPYAAQWLRNLIAAGHIASGEVDERDIRDVAPDDLAGFTQCHFFAGIGIWSLALRQAGWPDDRPVWTGSCPCQPFSAAGARGGFDDERHVWPAWFHLVGLRGPRVIFGEQVASKHALSWLDLVQSDLEGAGYAIGALDLCAAGVGAPHIRQRLYFVADREGVGRAGRTDNEYERRRKRASGQVGAPDGMGDGERSRLEVGRCERGHDDAQCTTPERASKNAGRLERADGGDASAQREQRGGEQRFLTQDGGADSECERPGPTNGFWRDSDWLFCADEKWRSVEPGTFPLAHGYPARVAKLRAAGNAICPEVARHFICAYLETRGGVADAA